ncbi:DNA-directed RNA polymerase III subunit 1-like isoform X1 [Chenopodium quinoa]|uniref:DNA-directed RNA polymerase III subunit 1-like isoform X1 n=2 Tax=Chenopodium quinoa TaxID=63459 RepID=UPI000B793088|nr:DNA-directed RNA polymerase III subunit 1-like isoform X1 [Chenopodium quinoa]XP_021734190.1 DNA-directed RNA polymerase III subunit 1-like isoform X1 [Chenopodium quinoa]XP_021734191.1 DNA-directed RNA polymerase III subunit 1-like isoform X1 [Chenopodium quinoa]
MLRPYDNIQFTKQPYFEDNEPRRIDSIKFSMFSASEIGKISEVEVFKGLYYDAQKRPIANGLLDPKMGPPNKSSGLCATCHAKFEDCPGHYGCLTLALPVFNIGYIGAILDVLKCICKSCSHILLPEQERKDCLKKMRNTKLDSLQKTDLRKKIIKKLSTKVEVQCLRCGSLNGKVKKGKTALQIVHSRPKQDKNQEDNGYSSPLINPHDALLLFNQMLDQDCELLYLNNRPENLIITNISVPPLALRPSVFVDGGIQSNENDITERLKRIIQANACLHQGLQEPSSSSKILDDWDYLQVEVAQYINSDVRVALQSQQPTKPLSGFVQRLKGKQGRFRGNLSGKRVEFTGRTVISPDPNLKITEVAVPLLMASILTYPECVNHHNIEKLRQCVRNGPKKYPGAKFVVEPNGDTKDLSFSARKRIADELKFGYIVHRHLEDGDVVLFNRQPSLHRMSIMCHRARIMPWRTLRFNESVCNPYNADFDGDEMNMHVPQTQEARAEALLLMGVQNNLCTPKNGTILVASTQDFLTSSYLITRKDTFYDRATFSLMCSYMGDGMEIIDLPTPALIKPVELWTGKQLFNVLLRPNAQLKVFVNLMVKEKIYRKIEDRMTLYCKEETMCPNDGFVYFRNSELMSGQLGKTTLGNGNKVGLFSVLVRDYNAHAAAACMNRLAKLSARWIGNHGFSIGIDDVQPGKELAEQKHSDIVKGYKTCDELIKSFNEGELACMPGCDASQTLEAKITQVLNEIREIAGKVCMKELHWRNSPLIMSQCGSKGSPINISQMVACVGQQAVGGRRAPDGFIDRSLPHFPRNSKTPEAKGFVANSFYSGLTATEFFFHTMGGREGLVDTAVKTADTGYMSRRLMKCLEDLAVHYDMTVRNSNGTIVQFFYGDDGMDPAQMEGAEGFPLDFERLRFKVEATCPARGNMNLSHTVISDIINKRLSDYDMSTGGGCSGAFKMKLLDFFNKLSERKCYVSEQQLQVFLDACISRLRLKRIEAGTAIGAIGAQSIGEPGTQMTLKTFHFAGVASMNVTLGVPRIKEIMNASKKISTPIIMAKLENDTSMEIAETVKGQIEKTLLGQVAKSIKLVMTSIRASVVVKLDMKKINALRLCINAYTVKDNIERSLAKRKNDKLNVKVLDDVKLAVMPDCDRHTAHFVLHRLKNKLSTIVVKGIDTVERAIIADVEGQKGKLNLIVEGTGLREVMGIQGVDGCKTESNHIIEVQQTLGIEAARSSIIREINKVMQSHSMDVDIRHMMLLADVMTFKGEVLAVTRVGIAKMKESILMLASFEKTADHLFNGSVNGREEKIEGVSECIIMGVPMQIGTGILKIMQRNDSLPALNYASDPIVS